MDGTTWIAAFAAELGVPVPDQDTVDEILRVAAVAAHASERWAAPVSCYLAAVAGWSPGDALELAERLADNGAR